MGVNGRILVEKKNNLNPQYRNQYPDWYHDDRYPSCL